MRFRPDPEIFGDERWSPARLFRLCRSKAYLFRGVEIRWSCEAKLAAAADVPVRFGPDRLSAEMCALYDALLAQRPG